ncbi:MAG: DUF1800 domain-containing protein [Dehalococcoidia bacterium]|nr:DUF1800 domain-containing protein [Dehalococcoidia bacterium]
MSQQEIELMAHLMRRAGFGATRDELESYVAQGYEAVVEQLLDPQHAPAELDDEDLIRRYHTDANDMPVKDSGQSYWLYRMINTRRPLEEKLALFWHGLLPSGYTKVSRTMVLLRQIEMFRRFGMGSFHTLLMELSQDPAMLFWLDNKDNHKDEPNENYGRELLELFSMGVGNYTEQDVYEASRAFTGWTIYNADLHTVRTNMMTNHPYGKLDWQFQYLNEDHDDGEKAFLGQRGALNGEDVIDIICRQPATARFLSRHLYNFFVADEPQVPAWQTVPPRDPEAIQTLVDAYFENDYHIRPILRVLFNSDFFKKAAFAKVKSPTEVVVGTVRLVGGHRFPALEDMKLAGQIGLMGQEILDPPSVEGWHTGTEWINSGALVQRVNFAVEQLADPDKPGVRSIIDRIASMGAVSPERLVDTCLDLVGPMRVSDDTRQQLVGQAEAGGEIRFDSEPVSRRAAESVKRLLQLIVSTREYQLC